MIASPLIKTPERWVWWFILGQFLLWVIVPTLVFRNLPLDVVEGLAWGHGWPLGTYKHPPLQAWMLELAALLGGRHDAAIYAVGAACLVLTYGVLWRFGRSLFSPPVALAAVVVLASCFYFATTIPEFNPNVVQMPLFALCGWLFWRAYRDDRWQDWVGFGLCAGLGMLSKYSFVVQLMALGGFVAHRLVVGDPTLRRLLHRPGPYLAVALGGVLFAPHFIWLLDHQWLPLEYARSRGNSAIEIGESLVPALGFLAGQALAIAPVLVILWLARQRDVERTPRDAVLRTYLNWLVWGPVLLILVPGMWLGGLERTMWGMALWPFIGLWAVERWQSDLARCRPAQFLLLVALLAMPVALICGALLSVPFGFRPWRTEFPGRELAMEADKFRQEQGQSLPIVLGDAWFGGNIAWYGQDRAQLMINGNSRYSPWVSPTDVAQFGALAVWDPDGGGEQTPAWATALGQVTAVKTVTLRYGKQNIRARFAHVMPASALQD